MRSGAVQAFVVTVAAMPGPRCIALGLAAAVLVGGCGGGSHKTGAPSGSPAGLSAEAKSAATGDIPDNQVFLTFHNRSAGYSIQYPEGWAQSGAGGDVTFRDKDNVVHIVVGKGPTPTPASMRAGLARGAKAGASLRVGTVSLVPARGGRAVKVSYTTLGAANPVTGKRLQLVVDRYAFARSGRVATVDLGTPKGVDNVDAYRMMSRSFRWQ
jgi:hypothetical protein